MPDPVPHEPTLADLEEQTSDRVVFDKLPTYTRIFIGEYNDVLTLARKNKKGMKFNNTQNTVIKSSEVEYIEAYMAKWTVVYTLADPNTTPDDPEDPTDPYTSRTWTSNSTQYEFPLERYLNATQAAALHKWDETDYEHKQQFKYFNGVDSNNQSVYVDLTADSKEKKVAQKKWAGVEAVMKFYPTVSLVSTYNTQEDANRVYAVKMNKLNKIDTFPNSQFPGVATWLKSACEWSQAPDESWTCTETWIGAPSWDTDLYGDNAWQFYGEGN